MWTKLSMEKEVDEKCEWNQILKWMKIKKYNVNRHEMWMGFEDVYSCL